MNVSLDNKDNSNIPLEKLEDLVDVENQESSFFDSIKKTLGIDSVEGVGGGFAAASSCDISKEISDFRLPITYLQPESVFSLNDIVATDLELINSDHDSSSSSSSSSAPGMYEYLLLPSNRFGKSLIPSWKTNYTTDVEFLKDTQKMVSNMDQYNEEMISTGSTLDVDAVAEIWNTVKKDDFFLEKYGFIDWDWEIAHTLNGSPVFLQFMSFMNIMSPAISLIMPFFILVFPFLLLKLQGIPISFENYFDTLKTIARHHFIGKTLMGLDTLSWDKVVYFLFTAALYCLQIYQNTTSCFRFYRNIKKINESLDSLKKYCDYSIHSMDTYLAIIQKEDLRTYASFSAVVENHLSTMRKMKCELQNITPFSHSVEKWMDFGYMMKCFYELHKNAEYESSWKFSMGFEGYLDNLKGIHQNLKSGNIKAAVFCKEEDADLEDEMETDDEDSGSDADSDEENKSELTSPSVNSTGSSSCSLPKKKKLGLILKGQYYPPLVNESPVKNDCYFGKNMIISAPNKAGKTTVLKTTTINIIFTQQIGCGFYESAMMHTPYTHFHSYLNIPDTSGRDSLFQAESRRCKEILDSINEKKTSDSVVGAKHFCIFDELYSGTNPEEACKAGCAFLKYLCKFSNVDFILTTHYLDICKTFKGSKTTQNFKMQVDVLDDGQFEYTYKMKPGISNIKGAIRVLKDMDYPKEITDAI
jgi:hypothetical protein